MKIELAKNSGFCFGVKNAVLRIINEINTADREILVYGPLIHNPQTIDILEKRGIKTIRTLDGINGKTVAIRTHGISLDKLKEIKKRSKRCINLTCAKVARVQGLIKKYSGLGYFTIILGDKNHPEVIGLKSYASAGVFVIADEEEITLVPPAEKYFVVSQTTWETELFDCITGLLKNKFSNIIICNTICHSTQDRQEEVKQAIKRGVDTLVVVGGRNSANTKRLVQLGLENGVKTLHVETEDELRESDFRQAEYVLVIAGASTPGWIINNILEKLYSIKLQKSHYLLNLLKVCMEFVIRINIISSLTAFFISLFVQSFIGKGIDFLLATLACLYIFSMYTLNNYLELESLKVSNPYKFSLYSRSRSLLLPVSLAAIAVSCVIAWQYDSLTRMVFLVSLILGSVYSMGWMKSLIGSLKNNMIRKIYSSKNIVVSLGWLIITAGIPFLVYRTDPGVIPGISSFLFCLIFLRNTLLDILALQGDRILGRETLPLMMGLKGMRVVSYGVTIACVLVYGAVAFIQRPLFLLFLFNIFYFTWLLERIINLNYLISLKYEILVDLNFILFILFCLILLIL